ncbi:MAG: hypothetical protein ACO3JH_06495 [Flavobacteriaceae bacterium]
MFLSQQARQARHLLPWLGAGHVNDPDDTVEVWTPRRRARLNGACTSTL